MLKQNRDRNQEATIFVGNLDDQVDESLLYELMIQVGPVVNVTIPRDRINQVQQGYAFVEFQNDGDVPYATQILNGIRIYSKNIYINPAANYENGMVGTKLVSGPNQQQQLQSSQPHYIDVGAKLFISNLDPLVDEILLQSTFEKFGTLIRAPAIAKTPTGECKGYAFLTFDSFDASDQALQAMNNQFLLNKPCRIGYAFKQGQHGQRHGDEQERALAKQTLAAQAQR